MKIRLRLALISITLTGLSMALCGVLLLNAAAGSSIRSAEEGALMELETFGVSYERALGDAGYPGMSDTARRSLALYLFRQYLPGQARFLLLRNGECLYNNTGCAAEKLLAGEPQKTVRLDGRTLFLAAGEEIPHQHDRLQIFLVRDQSAIYAGVRRMCAQFAGISSGAFLLSAAVITLCTFRALRPLRSLQENAAAIAGGVYDRRIAVRGRDEISELASSFNRMAEAIQAHVAALTATAEERRQLLGALTHELKTPMTAVIGYADTLQKLKLRKEQREEAVAYICHECRRLERLTQKMMRLLTLSGGESVRRMTAPASALLEAAEPTLRELAARRGVALTMDFADGSYVMDLDLMTSALVHLLENACDAGASHVVLRALPQRIVVEDDGEGIPPELLSRVAQPFFRADVGGVSRRSGGLGLGLWLVGRIAGLHGAALEIRSEPGRGTAVTLDFAAK
ncbi:MAG: HAMP domain-containing sensor histidine kinase [Clostridia bacterium]|nr:HAMP domain-containing sensor histidine kinase [Clostridia bacterium]